MGRVELIGDDHPLDHVADDCSPRTALQLDCYDRPVTDTPKRPVDTGDPRWAAKTGRHQTTTADLATDRAGGMGEVE